MRFASTLQGIGVVVLALGFASDATAAVPLSSAISYQGRLVLSGAPVTDSADFEATLWDAASDGSQVGSIVTVSDVGVVDGLFVLDLDFGFEVFNGEALWLQIAVRSPHDPGDTEPFTTLSPRQAITGAPYALQTRGLFVDNDGNVGIGTSSPATPLAILGNGGTKPVGITQNQVGGAGTMELTTEGDEAGDQKSRIVLRGGADATSVEFYTYIGDPVVETNTLFIEGNNGNVGIGTSEPSNLLSVNGDADFSGNVGIGTTTPTENLHVAGGNLLSDRGEETGGVTRSLTLGGARDTNNAVYAHIDFKNYDVGDSTPEDYVGASITSRNVSGDEGGDLRFQTKPTATDGGALAERMRIRDDGNVGIGVVSPDARLHVVDDGTADTAIHAEHSDTTGIAYGVFGSSASASGYGVRGEATATTGTAYGVYGSTGSASGWGLYASGRIGATGTKSFVIDHPQRPADEFLIHYCTEGAEPQNVYNGVVMLDANGEARVDLPDYFSSLNAGYRYQLTTIGGPALVYVSKEIEDNSFQVAGGTPGLKVSWQVTARRNDAFVRQYGAPVEVQKNSAEHGRYLMPKLHGQPEELGIHYVPSQSEDVTDGDQ